MFMPLVFYNPNYIECMRTHGWEKKQSSLNSRLL